MPDPERRTISASQLAGLWNQSPYVTRWMLWQWMRNNVPMPDEENNRMEAGHFLQDGILRWAAYKLMLDVTHHDETYVRHPSVPIGATRDGHCVHPEWGPGAVEAKLVDWKVWKDSWTDTEIPIHIATQLYAQMMVGNGDGEPYRWGVVACCVGGNDLVLYRRDYDDQVATMIADEARAFIEQVKNGPEPDPLGSTREIPGIKYLYPDIDLGACVQCPGEDRQLVVDTYERESAARLESSKLETAARTKLLAWLGEAELGQFDQAMVQVRKHGKGKTLKVVRHSEVTA